MRKITLSDVRNNDHQASQSFNLLKAMIARRTASTKKRLRMLEEFIIGSFRNKRTKELGERKSAMEGKEPSRIISKEEGAESKTKEKNKGEVNKRAPTKTFITPVSTPTALLPESFRIRIRELGGDVESIVFLIEKVITKTDLDPKQARFSIPVAQVQYPEFLNEREKEILGRKESLQVQVIEPCLEENNGVELRKWDLKHSSNYVLTKSWNSVAHNASNEWKGWEDTVQVWGYRVRQRLGLAIVVLPRKGKEEPSSSGINSVAKTRWATATASAYCLE